MTTLELIEPVETVQVQPRALAVAPSPADLLALALKQGASLEQLERLMALHERFEANEARRAMTEAMAAFKTEPLTIFKRKQVGYKTKDGDFVGYMHAELSDITDVVGPAMAQHGLAYAWDIKQHDGRVFVTCTVTHKRGHSSSVTMDAPPDSSGKKNTIQQIASATTYLQRYTLLAAIGMSTKGMDDDGNGGGDGGDTGATPPPPAPDTYPQDQFDKNLPAWTSVIREGRKTAEQLIAFVSSKAPLTEAQAKTLRAVR